MPLTHDLPRSSATLAEAPRVISAPSPGGLSPEVRRQVEQYVLRLCHAPMDVPSRRCTAFYMEVPAMRGVGATFPEALDQLEQLTRDAATFLAARGESFPPPHEWASLHEAPASMVHERA